MSAPLLLPLVLLGAVPGWLTDPAPEALLRWRTVPLTSMGEGLVAGEVVLGPGRGARMTLVGPAVVRLRGPFAAGCDPVVHRRFGSEDQGVDVPLPLSVDGPERLLALSPAVAPGAGNEEREVPVPYVLTLPEGCAAVRVAAFRAETEPDEYALDRMTSELRERVASAHGDGEAAAWLAAPHPHAWQAAAAWAFAAPELLARLPGGGEGARELARAWAEEAIAEARADDLSYAMQWPLKAAFPERRFPGPPEPFYLLDRGQAWSAEVSGAEAVRLFLRPVLEASDGSLAASRLEVRFDEGPPSVLLLASPADPENPGLGRLRFAALPVPPGARRVQLRDLDRPLLARGLAIRHKAHLESALATRTAAEHLARATAVTAGDPRGRLAAALARAGLGDAGALREAAALAGPAEEMAALVEVMEAERAADPAPARAALARIRALQAAGGDPLARAALAVLEERCVRILARKEVTAGRPRQAAGTLLELASRRPLPTEDAEVLAAVDAFIGEGLDTGALAALDGLVARRPLDHALLVARARAFELGTGWQPLAPDPTAREVDFLETPSREPQALRPGRSTYAPVSPGGGIEVVVPRSPLPGRVPVLSLAVVRGGSGTEVARVKLDEADVGLPILGTLERFDLPVAPGRHRVALEGAGFEGELFCNQVASPAALKLRRYAEVGPTGLELQVREVGLPAVALVTARVAVPPGAPVPKELELELAAGGARPVVLRVRPGAARKEARGTAGDALEVTAPAEASLPLDVRAAEVRVTARGASGARVLVRVALRRHRALVAREPEPGSSEASLPTLADTEAALSAVQRLTGQLARPGAGPEPRLARAVALADLDERVLAREDLLSALEDEALTPAQRADAMALWEAFDELGGSGPASAPAGVAFLSPELLLAAGRQDVPDTGLRELLADPEALGRLPAAGLRRRAGGGPSGELALLAAARRAEAGGEAERAAQLWLALAAAHPDAALVRREAGAALLATGTPAGAARAYLELLTATRLEPRDGRAHRLLRKAAARTRLRPLRYAEESAGSTTMRLSGGEPLEPLVEAILLGAAPGAEPAGFLTRGRQAHLSLSPGAPQRIVLRAAPAELRRHEAELRGAEAIFLEWSLDGGPPARARCEPGGPCQSEPIALTPGPHALVARLGGGLRPATWLWVEGEGAGGTAGGSPGHGSERLVARPAEPVRLTVHGPALVRVECRARADRRGAREVVVSARAEGRPPITRTLSPEPRADPRASLGDGSAVTPPAAELVPLEDAALYRLEVRPAAGEALVHLSVRDAGDEERQEEPPPPPSVAYRTLAPLPAALPPTLEQPTAVHVEDGDVAPGLDALGSLTIVEAFSHLDENGVGAAIQPTNQLATTFIYRRLLDDAHLTLKLSGEVRLRDQGAAAEWLGLDAFFRHPRYRSFRVLLSLDGYSQPVAGVRAYSGQAGVMLEPVATLLPGLHLVSKLGAWLTARSLSDVPDALLPSIDPDLYSRFGAAHWRGLFWEEGLEMEPLANTVLYGNARLTTNPSFSPLDQDHVSTTLIARSLFGRLYAEVSLRSTWFFVNADRPDPAFHTSAFASVFHTLWLDERQHVVIGLWSAFRLDTRALQATVYVSWEGSNGRRFQDHTPLEGEDYFFPQRGPGPERGRLEVRGP